MKTAVSVNSMRIGSSLRPTAINPLLMMPVRPRMTIQA